MAEQIPYGVATSLINRLASAAFREFGRIYGVMDQLERFKNTVESIRAVLLDAEEKQDQSHAVQIWIKRLKDHVLHPADNLLDEFVIEDMRQKMDKSPKSKVTQKTNNVKRETSSFVLESDIIGRENDKNEVINLLRQPHGNHNVSTVVIVGIGGLGKTALAQLVYNDSEVKEIFEKIMWVCVSDNFDVKTILKNMLKSLLPKEKIDDTLPLDNLQNMLHDKLTGKRYLLVLDDVWSESFEKWAQLRTYLMCGAQGSKVLVTTRNKTVAQTMGVSDPYVLNGLTLEESWGLLKNFITYGDETNGVNQNLESIGKKIAEKCSGVPLAIRTLGGLLQGKSEEREWIDILQGDFWKLCEDEESIMPVLKLSYQNLSPQLRQCFAYCSLYPKDWKIKKDELIQLWMAHGYLECSDENQSMEDIVSGNDCCYLNSETKRLVGSPMHIMLESDAIGLLESLDASRMRTLILTNKLNEKELSVISKFKYLRVLELWECSLKPLLSESFFPSLEKLTIIMCHKLKGWRRMSDDFNDDDDNSSQSYHLSFPRLSELYISNCDILTHIPAFPKLDKELTLRFSSVGALEATLNMAGSKGSIESHPLSMLKYLGIGGYDLVVEDFPKDWLQNLTSLKYLSFYKIQTKIFQEIWFPNDPNYLPCLENIKFDDCWDLEALPDWICNISSLQHICIDDCEYLDSLPEGLSRLAKLQTLEIIDCPLLIDECETETSATWPKIAHIPNIILERY
ncbi:hypothetical protein TSUD_354620 [Trifolium subterraneum]|uniref:NB-ARC domain-containing protein n=1 Tax=Trifolium subterraneum TaxID=3900 RepID=A0A2Z6MZX6_TRISU|nr:hypothetical protein TSUD_354620 [Trifolium subterraneum]